MSCETGRVTIRCGMNVTQAVSVAVCAGQLALALVGIARATRSPLAVPLALLCLDIFGWTGASRARVRAVGRGRRGTGSTMR